MPRTPRLVLKRRDPADSIGECGQSRHEARPAYGTVRIRRPRHIVPRRGYMMSFEESTRSGYTISVAARMRQSCCRSSETGGD